VLSGIRLSSGDLHEGLLPGRYLSKGLAINNDEARIGYLATQEAGALAEDTNKKPSKNISTIQGMDRHFITTHPQSIRNPCKDRDHNSKYSQLANHEAQQLHLSPAQD
jgi:hypothetical protein